MVLSWQLAILIFSIFTWLDIKQTLNHSTILLDYHTSKQRTTKTFSKLSTSILYHRYSQTDTRKLTLTCLQMFTRRNVVFAAYYRDKTVILYKLTWPVQACYRIGHVYLSLRVRNPCSHWPPKLRPVLRACYRPCLPFSLCNKSMLSLTSEINFWYAKKD